MTSRFERKTDRVKQVAAEATPKPQGTERRGAIPELPTLKYGPDANYGEFKKALSTFARREYGNLGKLIETLKYYVPEHIEFEEEDIAEAEDPHGFRKAVIMEEFKERTREMAKMKTQRPALFAVIWGQLSTESEERVRQTDNYVAEVESGDDPLALWLAIRETHIANTIGTGPLDRKTARKQYAGLKQGVNESVTMFKERTDEALAALAAVGADDVTPTDQAADFLDRLDPIRYADLMADLENNAVLNVGTYPKTLTEAYNVAARYKLSNKAEVQMSTSSGRSVFTTDTEKRRDTFKCRLCGEAGHAMAKCSWLEDAREVIKSKRAPNKDDKDDEKEEVAALTIGGHADYDHDGVVF